ncbi:MAG: acetyl/propionyl/methylcrotonyl-CoA carboxylase subunit alpha [Frankiales bacterium]|nr:acetyl/propionyl/methylcrotonyl-CoA carboxylase subunit alpha [Frankiales bacterium]
MFDTVLVANRGEIACRVISTLRRLGVRSVAVYSDADAGARHVREADVAVRIGPANARESYLSIEAILAACGRTGAQAVHPGYGFLAENVDFATVLQAAGIVLVGPPAAAMQVMGDKIRAKLAVSAAGVPVVPGRTEPAMTDADLIAAAVEVGFPVLVKPSAGGGGKGMRLVHQPGELAAALVSARREAASSFGDDTLFLERFVLRPRHIEVQVLADAQGATVHLAERECSLQRRHQKVIEEAPSVLLDAAQRARIGAAAVATAQSVGYTGAGTVEFIVSADAPDEFFFMEMNTRLQVEHPVTELVVRVHGAPLDLVEQQLLVAAGESLTFGQDDVQLDGHAVEARLYAEDPSRGFLPTGGQVLLLREPVGPGVRVDSGLLTGLEIGATYDPMLGKVIAWGPDRATALARLDRALADTVVLGVVTNTAFLRALLTHPDVRAGRLDTALVERELATLATSDIPEQVYVAYALARLLDLPAPIDPWDTRVGWRLSGRAPTTWQVAGSEGAALGVTVWGGPDQAQVQVGSGSVHNASGTRTDDGLLVTVAGTSLRVLTATDGPTTWLWVDGVTYAVTELPPARQDATAGVHDGDVRSPMPGTVVSVAVTAGATVGKGEVLVVVEAMKMEHSLTAPFGGTVGQLDVRVGDSVALDQLLAVVTAA